MKGVVHAFVSVNTFSIQKMQAEKKTAIVQLRLRPSLKEAAERVARADQRSLTGLIEKLLVDRLRDDARPLSLKPRE